MKKNKILLVFLIIFCFFSFAENKKTIQSIENTLEYPFRDWYLKTNGNQIELANVFQRIYYRVGSIFSSYHKNDLAHVLYNVLNDLSLNYNDYNQNYNEIEKVAIDKIFTIISQQNNEFWFSHNKDKFLALYKESWSFQKQHNIDTYNLSMPIVENGYYYNNNNDQLSYVTFQEVSIFLSSMFKTGTNIDLSTLRKEDSVLSKSIKPSVQWIGHASFLIQVEDLNIITDPVTEAFHPLLGSWLKCFKRYTMPGITLQNLPKIDVVVISHNHLDHLEDKALLFLKRYQPLILVPMGLKKYFVDRGFEKVFELNWWESVLAKLGNKNVEIYAVPAKHNSMTRGGIQRQKSLWCGWLVKADNKTIYFAGDTAYDEKMLIDIHNEFSDIDIALLPIAPDKMIDRHMDHLQAIDAFDVLHGKIMVPMHWGAYRTGDEKIEDPLNAILQIKKNNPTLDKKIKILKIGERLSIQ